MGAPGVGKSAFAAHLAHYGRDKVIAVQFCEYDKPDHRDARRIVRTLAFQLATRLPDYRKLLLTLPEIAELDRKNPAELFDYLLAGPLRHVIDGGRERYLIVIDALDEAGGNGRNELVEMLERNAPRLPDWIGIVVTSHPESDVIAPLQGLNPFIPDTATGSNRADIRDYLRRELAAHLQNRADVDRLVEQILEKSEGVFLYVERFCDDVQHDHLSLDRPEQFPQGLGGTFFQYFQRQFPDLEKFRKDVRPALRAILAAREPLPVEILQRLFNWQDEELRDFTRPFGSLFPVTTPAGHKVIKPYHKSLADWLADEAKAGAYFVSVLEGHRLLAEFGWHEFNQRTNRMLPYLLTYLPHHLIRATDRARLLALLSDQWFWENSPVFSRQEFYGEIMQLFSTSEAIEVLTPVHQFFADRATAISPQKLGFALFPHEPGVNFVNGTSRDGYMIPPGVEEPPSEVLWDFIRICHSVFKSSAAFLRGATSPTVVDWYRDYWKGADLQNTLDQIERYYDTHHPHLSFRAMELSYMIDKALEENMMMESVSGPSVSRPPDNGKI
jgi:hypothetical protein